MNPNKKKEKPDKCRIKVAGSKQTILGAHKFIDSPFDPRYQTCQNCGKPRRKPG